MDTGDGAALLVVTAREGRFGLPDLLETVADCCGLATAAALAGRYGGLDVYIPRPENIAEDHELALALGVDAARKVADAVGPGRVNVPFGPFGGSVRQRRATVMRLLAGGGTKAGVARGLGIHERSVYRIAQEQGERPPPPLPLFPEG